MQTQRRRAAEDAPSVAEGSERVVSALREQQRQLGAAIARLGSADATDVHHGRVAARRMRSLLKTIRPLLDRRRARLLRADLRSFARTLSAVRESDVRRDLLVGLARRDPAVAPMDFQRLSVRLEDRCLEARAVLRRHLVEPGWPALCAALTGERIVDELGVRADADLAEVLRLIGKIWRKAVRLLVHEPRSAVELHRLRLALKHCRYALEVVADLRPKPAARLLLRLRSVQDGLGEHRDALLAIDWVRANERLLGKRLTSRLVPLLARHERKLHKRAARRVARLLPAYRQWRVATRALRKATSKDRA
jgi:CHAD domain-containing protein